MSASISAAQFLAATGITTDPGVFGLSATRNETAELANRVNTINWTWPNNMVGHVPWWRLTLQRSTNATNGFNSLIVISVGSLTAPAADPFRWTTLTSWTQSEYLTAFPDSPYAGTYSDPWPSIGMVAYRLIFNFALSGDPVLPPYKQMTWNMLQVVPVQPLSICSNNSTPPCSPLLTGSDKIRLSWGAPDFTYWDTITFISGSHCSSNCFSGDTHAGGWNRIDIIWPPKGSPAGVDTPIAYYLYSSPTNVTYTLRAQVNPPNPFFIPTPEEPSPMYYKVRAVFASSTLDSNVVLVTH